MVKRSVLAKALEELEFDESDVDALVDELASCATGVVSQARARIKTAYRKAALKWHPDKSKQRRESKTFPSNASVTVVPGGDGEVGIAEERFKRISAAYELLTDENRRIDEASPYDESDEEDFDYEEYCRSFRPRDELYEIFKSALLGKDVENELRKKGCHRPPADFGVSPFPPFDLNQLNLHEQQSHKEKENRRFDYAMQAFKSHGEDKKDEERNYTQSFIQHLKENLQERKAELHEIGASGVDVRSVTGEFTVVRKYRKGIEKAYPNFELSVNLSCRLDVLQLSNNVSKAVPACVVVPYFGDECEEEEIQVEIQMLRKKDELRCKRAVHESIREGLKKVVAPMLLRCIQESINVGKEEKNKASGQHGAKGHLLND